MRSRSRRFFVVLLHLVGCQHSFNHHNHGGIVGVQPWPIVLERWDPATAAAQPPPGVREPLWLQDFASGLCLGPTGRWTACGDATTWWVVSRKHGRRRRWKMGIWGADEERQPKSRLSSVTEGLAFYVADPEITSTTSPSSEKEGRTKAGWKGALQRWWHHRQDARQQRRDLKHLDCLMREPGTHRLGVQTCGRGAAWGWQLDESGLLRPLPNDYDEEEEEEDLCLAVRGDDITGMSSWEPRFVPCEGDQGGLDGMRKARISLVRYHAVTLLVGSSVHDNYAVPSIMATPSPSPFRETDRGRKPCPSPTLTRGDGTQARHPTLQVDEETLQPPAGLARNLPSNKDLAHVNANEAPSHKELELSSSRMSFRQSQAPALKQKKPNLPGVLRNSHPIFLLENGTTAKSKVTSTAGEATASSSSLHRRQPRRIPVHPYIAASKNDVWKDPQTGLEYPTDLSSYLGHDRKERGRQTLMGVGQYRKGYVVKVYGVAFYVSKRDVLADDFFVPFAHLEASELRSRPEFYKHLREDAHNFERTLMIKTNMQLAAQTIRDSLHHEWKMLTEEAKDKLIGCSIRERPATQDMLALIKSPDNPGRCSCSQIAPEEYQADPECCARGTELVFSWVKSGNLEVRLNGLLVESFPRPDMAEGIFYEYLRMDDPMSPEFIDNAILGFPFLLAPLAQVKGVHIGASTHGHKSDRKETSGENPIARAAGEMFSFMASQAAGFAGAVQHAAGEASSHFFNASHSAKAAAEEFAQHVGREAQQRKEWLVLHAGSFKGVMHKIANHEQDPMGAMYELWEEIVNERRAQQNRALVSQAPLSTTELKPYEPLLPWFDNASHYYAPDEIEPMIVNPTMNLTRVIFLFLVHLYLLLLFIVSFPGSYTTHTKFIRKSVCTSRDVSDSESECSDCSMSKDVQHQRMSVPPDLLTSQAAALRRARATAAARKPFAPRMLLSPSSDENQQTHSHQQNHSELTLSHNGQYPVKKSLSYFL